SQFLSKERALAALREADDGLVAGLSSPGRMHDLLVACEAVSPGDVIRQGARLEIRYAFAETDYGQVLLG
ncbi:MAG: bifunctional transcriptional activator/DNA repair enzyme protein Ada, partial [Burkholderiaceae bacterium]